MGSRIVTFKGSPLTLVGRAIKEWGAAPDFRVMTQDLKETGLTGFTGKIKVISSFPSLDTPVCDLQVKEFNKRAHGISEDVVIIGISKDLPFAQKRFCQENEIEKETVISDYKYSSFGINYGMLIKELNLLARAVHILDKNNILCYKQIAPELTVPLDYDAAINGLGAVLKGRAVTAKTALPAKCKPCEAGSPPLEKDKVEHMMAGCTLWQLIDGKKISREFKFKDYEEAKYFLDMISVIAEDQGHHPALTLTYNKLKIVLTTHSSGGLTENDFIMAKIIDEIGG